MGDIPPMGDEPMNDMGDNAPMDGEEPMGDDPMNDMGDNSPMGGDDPMNDMGDNAPMDGEEPMGDEPMDNMGGNPEIDNVFNQLDTEKQSAVLKYAKSMVNDTASSNMGSEPMDNANSMPSMGESKKYNLDEIIDSVINGTTSRKRGDKNITNTKLSKGNPFVYDID